MVSNCAQFMKFNFRFPLILLLLFVAFGFTTSSNGVITDNYPFLPGKYELLVIYRNEKVIESSTKDIYTLEITKKDEFIVYKNGKKYKMYHFNNGRAPVSMGSEDYVMFNKKNQHFPLFYKGDTIIQFIYPNEFDDNYFIKIK